MEAWQTSCPRNSVWEDALVDDLIRLENEGESFESGEFEGEQFTFNESGEVFSIPYDYCLRPEERANPRCAPPAAVELPDDGVRLLYTTPFGSHRNQRLREM